MIDELLFVFCLFKKHEIFYVSNFDSFLQLLFVSSVVKYNMLSLVPIQNLENMKQMKNNAICNSIGHSNVDGSTQGK